MGYYKEVQMGLKKILLENSLISDVKILDVLMTYVNEAAEVSAIISEVVKVFDSEIIEEYKEKVEDGLIKEFIREESSNRVTINSDPAYKVNVLMTKKELMDLFEKAIVIEACSKMHRDLFMISQNTLVKYLREYERAAYLEENLSILKRNLHIEQEKNNSIYKQLEEKQFEITRLQIISDGIEKEYLDLVEDYNAIHKELKATKEEIKQLKETVIESKEIITIYEQDKRFQKAHDKYPDDQLYKLVIEAILPYVQDKRLPSQRIIRELKENDMIQDFLCTRKFKLDTATNLTNLYDISIQLVGKEYGLTINDIRSKQTRKRLIEMGKLK